MLILNCLKPFVKCITWMWQTCWILHWYYGWLWVILYSVPRWLLLSKVVLLKYVINFEWNGYQLYVHAKLATVINPLHWMTYTLKILYPPCILKRDMKNAKDIAILMGTKDISTIDHLWSDVFYWHSKQLEVYLLGLL